MLFMLANLISERHPLVDHKKQKPSMPWDYYPDLFTQEKQAWEQRQEEDELEAYKERRRQYIAEFNKRRREV